MPSSRYFSVAGPNDSSRSAFAAASTAGGSASGGFTPAPRTATALRRFAPITAPSPPRPAWRPSCDTVAKRTSRSPAGPIAATRQAGPSRSRRRSSAAAADRPQRSSAGSIRAPSPSTSSTEGSSHAPRTTIASLPVSLPWMAKWLEASASFSRPVSGDFATTANFALVVSGVPTRGEKTNASGASGPSGSTSGGASRCISQVPSPAPPMQPRRTGSGRSSRSASPLPTSTTSARPK